MHIPISSFTYRGVVNEADDFKLIRERLEKGFQKNKVVEEVKIDYKKEEEEMKRKLELLPPREKQIKEELKEESLDLLWRLCQESVCTQGVKFAVHKGAIDGFAIAMYQGQQSKVPLIIHNNIGETKWKYIGKIMEKLQQNESVISICSVLKKFLQQLPEGDINKIRNPGPDAVVNDLEFPETRIEMISKLDKDYALMNELMSLNIEFKRNTLDMIYDHLGKSIYMKELC